MKDFDVRMKAAALLLNQGKYSEALAAFDFIIDQDLVDGEIAQVYQQRGIIFRKMNRYQDSIDSFQVAASRALGDPLRSADIQRDLAMTYFDDSESTRELARDAIIASIRSFEQQAKTMSLDDRHNGRVSQANIGIQLGRSFLGKTLIREDPRLAKRIFIEVRHHLKNLNASPTVQLNNMLALISVSKMHLLVLWIPILKIAYKIKRKAVLTALMKVLFKFS